jgi:hypothetical protein
MVPADDMTMQVNVDWRQGDAVTTVVSGIETVARVTEVAYSITSSGVLAGAALGDVSGFTQKDAESAKVQSIDSRVSNLERASAGPVDWARIINEPTAFPPAAHTHPWDDVTGKPTSYPPSAHSASLVTSGVFAAARIPAASETAAGAVERATQAETDAGADAIRYVSPATLKALIDKFRPDTLPAPFRTVTEFGATYPIGTPASTWGSVIATAESPLLNLPAPAWVRLDYGAILSASTGYARIGLAVSGTIDLGPLEDGQGEGGATGGLSPFHLSPNQSWTQGSKTVLLPAGSYRFVLQSMRSSSSATCTCNYPMIQITPLRWG